MNGSVECIPFLRLSACLKGRFSVTRPTRSSLLAPCSSVVGNRRIPPSNAAIKPALTRYLAQEHKVYNFRCRFTSSTVNALTGVLPQTHAYGRSAGQGNNSRMNQCS
ncbi:hypothetical protein TRVL_00414 [Trypanosoma vivax]|uniref:Uncharacterized protein n=1 Tax=Trypanosoma vivax (strain Y486) TaxID=1055687 RepID=G0U7U8_TRYVY|nr:hypothetical protein TRVL_00414 [Trypanosoma vivax]CCC51956.1 hypothetical protein, unlikely [Trypanosoma vivax Y486]